VAEEIELLACGYPARCTADDYICLVRATTIARYTDGQGRVLRQQELCDWHADNLKADTPGVRDSREPN
jgi:hypothetical protein